MALNSTPRRRFGVALGVVLAGVTAGFIGFAGTASAHNGGVEAACKGDTTTLAVHLKAYANKKGKENHIKITDNGKVLVDEGFPDHVDKDIATSGAEDHVFVVTVRAWDSAQYNLDKELKVAACVTVPPPPATDTTTTTTTTTVSAPPTTTTTSSTPEAAPVVATTTSAPPAAQGGPLAETGASIALPLGIAGVLLVGGAVMLFVVRRRSKA